jgi:hypothetical protein
VGEHISVANTQLRAYSDEEGATKR